MLTLYGLKNCDTCRKTLKQLNADGINHTFINFKTETITPDTMQAVLAGADLTTFINRRGTTWRNLDAITQQALEQGDVQTFLNHTSVIKRPVWALNGKTLNGYTPTIYQQATQS